MKKILFEFGNNKAKGGAKGIAEAIKAFTKAGMKPVDGIADTKTLRSAGRSYRKIQFFFEDSQRVEMWVTFNKNSPEKSGDIFKIKLGGTGVAEKMTARELPIKNQDNHLEAIKEVVTALKGNVKKFQVKLAKIKAPLPPKMTTSRVNQITALRSKVSELDIAIAETDKEIAKYKN